MRWFALLCLVLVVACGRLQPTIEAPAPIHPCATLGGIEHDTCIFNLATNTKDSTQCAGILSSEAYRTQCLIKTSSNPMSICNSQQGEAAINNCLIQVVEINRDSNICNSVVGDDQMFHCFAMARDLTACERLPEQERKDACWNKVAYSLAKYELCNNIIDTKLQTECKGSFTGY